MGGGLGGWMDRHRVVGVEKGRWVHEWMDEGCV